GRPPRTAQQGGAVPGPGREGFAHDEGHYLHRLREIERTVVTRAGYRAQALAKLELAHGKPGALGAEDERDPRPRARMQLAGKLRAGRSRRDRRRAELAPGCAQPQGQGGVGERRFEAVATAGGEQHVIRAAGQCDRLGMPQDSRISRRDEDETREAHDADRAGGRPDVAWVTRFDEDEIDAP